MGSISRRTTRLRFRLRTIGAMALTEGRLFLRPSKTMLAPSLVPVSKLAGMWNGPLWETCCSDGRFTSGVSGFLSPDPSAPHCPALPRPATVSGGHFPARVCEVSAHRTPSCRRTSGVVFPDHRYDLLFRKAALAHWSSSLSRTLQITGRNLGGWVTTLPIMIIGFQNWIGSAGRIFVFAGLKSCRRCAVRRLCR